MNDSKLLFEVKKQIIFYGDGCVHRYGPCGFYWWDSEVDEICCLFDEHLKRAMRCEKCLEIIGDKK